MNAPLPLEVTREAAGQAYDQVSRASNEVAGRLAQRLAAETQGGVLFSPADRGKHIELQLDGVATFATIWFNGTLVARNWSGYNSTYIDLTPYVTYGDGDNSLVVRVDATAMEGWWYEGGGIYRDAWIVKRNPVHIVTDGVFAHPLPDPKGPADWKIPVEVTLNNAGKSAAEVTALWTYICDRLEKNFRRTVFTPPAAVAPFGAARPASGFGRRVPGSS